MKAVVTFCWFLCHKEVKSGHWRNCKVKFGHSDGTMKVTRTEGISPNSYFWNMCIMDHEFSIYVLTSSNIHSASQYLLLGAIQNYHLPLFLHLYVILTSGYMFWWKAALMNLSKFLFSRYMYSLKFTFIFNKFIMYPRAWHRGAPWPYMPWICF